MELVTKSIIKGCGFFEGEVEGQQYMNGQIFVEEPFDRTKPNYKGFRTVEYKCADSSLVKSIFNHDFPITADIRLEITATKRGQSVVVTGIKPTGAATPTPPASVVRPAA